MSAAPLPDLAVLVAELLALTATHFQRYPDPMYTAVTSEADWQDMCQGDVSDDLKTLYGAGRLFTEPWADISLCSPYNIGQICAEFNHSTSGNLRPFRVERGIRAPLVLGRQVTPFGYHDDGYYCVDREPDFADGGFMGQIIHVSRRTKRARVVAVSLRDFLAHGLALARKELAQGIETGGVSEADPLSLTVTREAFPRPVAAAPQSMIQITQWLSKVPQTTALQRDLVKIITARAQHSDQEDPRPWVLPPLTQGGMQKIEQLLGQSLPDELREFLLVCRFLSTPWAAVSCVGFLSVGSLIAEVKHLRSLVKSLEFTPEDWGCAPGIQPPVFGKTLIPFGEGGDPGIFYDLAPEKDGQLGQLVEVCWEELSCRVMVSNLTELIASGVRAIATD